MIELHTERIIPLREVNKLPYITGRHGKRINLSTVWRWTLRGIKGVRLESIRIGGKMCTSIEAVERFIEQLNNPTTPAVRSTRQRAQALEQAERACDALGV